MGRTGSQFARAGALEAALARAAGTGPAIAGGQARQHDAGRQVFADHVFGVGGALADVAHADQVAGLLANGEHGAVGGLADHHVRPCLHQFARQAAGVVHHLGLAHRQDADVADVQRLLFFRRRAARFRLAAAGDQHGIVDGTGAGIGAHAHQRADHRRRTLPGCQHGAAAAAEAGVAGRAGAAPAVARRDIGQGHALRQAVEHLVLAAGRGQAGIAHHDAVGRGAAGDQGRRIHRLADPQVGHVGVELAEVVGLRVDARLQRQPADDRNRLALRRAVATGGTRHRLPALRLRRLVGLGHLVAARAQVREVVAAIAVGDDRGADRVAEVVDALQHDLLAGDAGFTGVDASVVVVVVPHLAGDGCRRDLAEVVGHRVFVGAQHDAADRRRRGGHRGGVATVAAGTGTAVERACRLFRLGHGIGARRQSVEQVVAVLIGTHLGHHRVALGIGAGQAHGHAGDAVLADRDDAIVVAVQPHPPGDGAVHRDLAEVVLHRVLVLAQHDVADRRRRGGLAGRGGARQRHAADVARHRLAVERQRRLVRLGDGIGARRQVGEQVAAVVAGGGGAGDRVAIDVGAGQLDRDAADALLARVDHAVVVVVHPHPAGDGAAGRDLGEQVLQRLLARGHGDAGDLRRGGVHAGRGAGGDTAYRSFGGDAVGGARRLVRLVQGVGARQQLGERERAVVGGRRGGDHRAARVAQLDGLATDAAVAAVLHAVVVVIHEHAAVDLGAFLFAEVVVLAVAGQADAADAVGGRRVAGHAGLRAAGAAAGTATGTGLHRAGPVQVPGRQHFAHGVGLGRVQADELVETIGVGERGPGRTGDGHVVAADQLQQFQGGAGDGLIRGRVAHVVDVLVQEHVAGQRVQGDFREVELHALAAAAEHHPADDATAGHDAGAALVGHAGTGAVAHGTRAVGLRQAVVVATGHGALVLVDGVTGGIGRRQPVEHVVAVDIGGNGDVDRVAVDVGTGQAHADVGQAVVAGVGIAVVVLVDEHAAADAGIAHLYRAVLLVVVRIAVLGQVLVGRVLARLHGRVVVHVGQPRPGIHARLGTRMQGQGVATARREIAVDVASHLLNRGRAGDAGDAVGDIADVRRVRRRRAGLHGQGAAGRGQRGATGGGAHARGGAGNPLEAGRQRIHHAHLGGGGNAVVAQHDLPRHGLADVDRRDHGGLAHHFQVGAREQHVVDRGQVVAGLERIGGALAGGFVTVGLVRADVHGIAEDHRGGGHAGGPEHQFEVHFLVHVQRAEGTHRRGVR